MSAAGSVFEAMLAAAAVGEAVTVMVAGTMVDPPAMETVTVAAVEGETVMVETAWEEAKKARWTEEGMARIVWVEKSGPWWEFARVGDRSLMVVRPWAFGVGGRHGSGSANVRYGAAEPPGGVYAAWMGLPGGLWGGQS